MKNAMYLLPVLLLLNTSFISCKKETAPADQSKGEAGYVTGKVTDSKR